MLRVLYIQQHHQFHPHERVFSSSRETIILHSLERSLVAPICCGEMAFSTADAREISMLVRWVLRNE